MKPEHPHVSTLGHHLVRSVVRNCLTAQDLDELLPPLALHASRARRQRMAEALVERGGAPADAVQQRLDQRHAGTVARFAGAVDALELQALWQCALRGDFPLPGAYWAVLTHPLADHVQRQLAFAEMEMLMPAQIAQPLEELVERRSVSPRRLGPPAPDAGQLDRMIQAALSAPDHGRLHPWRVLEFLPAQREALADLFEAEKLRRDPLALAKDLRRAREHATQSPCLLGFVVSPRPRKRIPAREQWLAAGAALGNLLNAAHQLGFGAIMLSGERCFDETLMRDLGLAPGEQLAGFISIGTTVEAPPQAGRPLSGEVWSRWAPGGAARRDMRGPFAQILRQFSDEGLE